MEKNKKQDGLEKFLNFILTKNTGKYLLLIALVGFILRLIIVRNVSFLGDEMIHGVQSLNILKSGMIGTALESPVWYYLTDISTSLFGVTIYGSRLTSLLYGTFSILIVYLIASYLFNKKTGLISSFLLAISAFTIRYTLIEMDVTLTFFLLLSIYFLIKGTRENNKNLIYLSITALGIGALVKTIALFFAPAIFIYIFFSNNENLKKKLKSIVIYGLILLILISPLIVYNYLLYKDKGYTDLYVGQYFKINIDAQKEIIEEKYLSPFSVHEIAATSWQHLKSTFWGYDAPILILAVLGIILSLMYFRNKDNYLLLGMLFSGWIIQTGTNSLATHYIPYSAIFAIYGGYGLNKILTKNKKIKYLPGFVLVVIFLINLFLVQQPLIEHMKGSTGNKELREYVIKTIPDNAITIADSRIYRGRISWLFNDRINMESEVFKQVLLQMQQNNYTLNNYDVYFVECVLDDCGWGTVGNSELNKSTEEIIGAISYSNKPVKQIPSGGGYDEEYGTTHFNIYHFQISLPKGIENSFRDRHWLFHPIINKGEPEDKYTPQLNSFGQKMLWLISYIILWLSIILAILAPIDVLYMLIKQKTFNIK